VNGKQIIFLKGILKKDGKKFVMEQYALAAGEEETIIVTGFYDPKQKSTFQDSIRKAAVSAHLK
jgi:hypothetical protein